MNKYKDIINLSRPKSKYPSMSLNNRSAQFAPFSALTGYDEKIKEIARITHCKLELAEDEKLKLNVKLEWLKKNIRQNPKVTITYFVADKKKSGGSYQKITDNIKKIDEIDRYIILMNQIKIYIDDIIDIKDNII